MIVTRRDLRLTFLALFLAMSGCTHTVKDALRSDDDLPRSYGLILPWSAKEYIGYPVTSPNLHPGQRPMKAVLTIGADQCVDSLAHAASGPASASGKQGWSTTFKYKATNAADVAIPGKCVEGGAKFSNYDGGTFTLDDVRVYEGLGYPSGQGHCLDVSIGRHPILKKGVYNLVDRVAVASSMELKAAASQAAGAHVSASCLGTGKGNAASAKASLNRDSHGTFTGKNIVIAAEPIAVHLSEYGVVLDTFGPKDPTETTVFDPLNGKFRDQPVPDYLQNVTITLFGYKATAGDKGEATVGVSGVQFASSTAPDRCQTDPTSSSADHAGALSTYLVPNGGTCKLYFSDRRTVLLLTLSAGPTKNLELRALHRSEIPSDRTP